MIYAKHPEFGNGHFPDGERATLEAQGWVIWPRTKEQQTVSAAPVVSEPLVQSSPPDATDTPEAAPLSRAQMLCLAAERKIKVDRRWNDERLARELGL